MNLNGQSSKNKNTILNGKALYGYDNAKKARYQWHMFQHRSTVQKWRGAPRQGARAKLWTILAFVILIIILNILVVFVFGVS